MISSNNILKIVDFGLSNFYSCGNNLKTACGSPCYAAPEMIMGKKYNGLRVDIWSLGIVLFAMVCGYLPFDNKDTSSLYQKITSGDYEIPIYIKEPLRGLIKGILNIDPEKRFTVEEIKKNEWFKKFKNNDAFEGIIFGVHDIEANKKYINFFIFIID